MENNSFDFDSLSDLIMHVNYTAREGGPEFRREGNASAQRHVPGDGYRFLDIRHELPEVWNVVRREIVCEACKVRKCAGREGGVKSMESAGVEEKRSTVPIYRLRIVRAERSGAKGAERTTASMATLFIRKTTSPSLQRNL